MRDFEDSTLWRVSAFERTLAETGNSGFARLDIASMLPTTLLADLRTLGYGAGESDVAVGAGTDVLEVIASCARHRQPALLCLQHEGLVWPLTLFPEQNLYHSPRDMRQASEAGLARLSLLTVEPPGVRPPGHWMHERIGLADCYHDLQPMLWSLALHGPRKTLLTEIGGTAAYRMIARPEPYRTGASGALSPAIERLRRESVSLREMTAWPGLGIERASRVLNGLYLCGALLITRSHPAARAEPGIMGRWLGSGKSRH